MLILDCDRCKTVTEVEPVPYFGGYLYICHWCLYKKERPTSAHQDVTPSVSVEAAR